MEIVDIFYLAIGIVTAIWYMLWSFGIFYPYYTKKNILSLIENLENRFTTKTRIPHSYGNLYI
jgi:hypothetical protein